MQISGKFYFKQNLLYWQRMLASPVQNSYPKSLISFSCNHPVRQGSCCSPPVLAYTLTPRACFRETAGELCREGQPSRLCKWVTGPKVTSGLYSRLPPVGGWGWQAGPLGVRLCCHQHDDSVVPAQDYHPAEASQGLHGQWPLRQGGLVTTCVLGAGGEQEGGGLSYSCPKPSVSSIAYSSFSLSCS